MEVRECDAGDQMLIYGYGPLLSGVQFQPADADCLAGFHGNCDRCLESYLQSVRDVE
jgi:hypothetical protein